jgi:diaminopimelate decarboxylase
MTEWDYDRLVGLAGRHGTPVHVLDPARLDRAVDRLRSVLGGLGRPTRVYYSVKTNYLPAICRQLSARGIGADVVSGYELEAALRTGFAPADMVFNGPVKTEPELAEAVRRNVRVNLDGQHEVALLDRIAGEAGRTVDVGLRLSPGLAVSTSTDPSYVAQAQHTARRARFGWPVGSPQLAEMVAAVTAARHVRLTAVHAHLSSQIVHEDLMLRALEPVLAEAGRLHRRFGLREVNIGGGFGVPGVHRPRVGPLTTLWRSAGGPAPVADEDPPFEVDRLLPAVDRSMDGHGLAGVTLACEPGRWLVSDAMATVTRVMVRKELPDVRWLILDAGNHVAPWTGTGERHRLVPIGRRYSDESRTWAVAGPLCYENDVHDTAVDLPADLTVGDLLCLHDTGAYSLGRSNNFIRLRAAVVAFDGPTERLVWRPEAPEDVFAFADPPEVDRPAPVTAEAAR